MITSITRQEYIAFLIAFDNYSIEEAIDFVDGLYKKQWGMTPQQHKNMINKIWTEYNHNYAIEN